MSATASPKFWRFEFPPQVWIAEMHGFLSMYNTKGLSKGSKVDDLASRDQFLQKKCSKAAMIPVRLTLKQPGTHHMKYGPTLMLSLKTSEV